MAWDFFLSDILAVGKRVILGENVEFLCGIWLT
jgi:hypothetical protein